MGYIWIPAIMLLSAIFPVPVIGGGYEIGPDVYHMDYSGWITDDPGRVVLAGHNPGVFGNIADLAIDDVIIIESTTETVRYRVVWRWITTPESWQWPPPNGNDLFLITCWDGEEKRLIVRAVRVE
jgi:LPXTG-site transpeptidase (sortase) family protein